MKIMQADITFEWEEFDGIDDHYSAQSLAEFVKYAVHQIWDDSHSSVPTLTLGAYGEK